MFLRAVALAGLMALAAPSQAYVSYSFTGYADEDDPRFPAFTFYTNDFLTAPGPGEHIIPISPSMWVSSTNVALISVLFRDGPFARDGFLITTRYAYPGTENKSLTFDRTFLGQAGSTGNGIGILTVQQFDGPIPAFTFTETDPGPFPGSTNIPIGGFPPVVDPPVIGPPATGAIPEPATWGLLIAGFGLVGAAARRRRIAITHA